MMPHEAQATMAKILFFIFATFVLCLGKARAHSVTVTQKYYQVQITQSQALSFISKNNTYY
jgi:hypothetical protein